MKNKVFIIFLILIFIVILFGISHFLKGKETIIENTIQSGKEKKMSVLEVNKSSFEEEILKSEKPVLVDFYADWCGPCKMLAPIVDQIAEEKDDIKVCRINIDENEELAVKYQILSIPTLVVIKNGEESQRMVGLVEKEDILEMIK